MGRNPRSVSIPREFAVWLRQWWSDAMHTGNGRKGADIENTPGVAFEVKTEKGMHPEAWTRQAYRQAGGNLPVVVYFPPGVAMGSPERAVAMLPLDQLMKLLTEAEYTP